jgi:hypothetical protein
MTWLRLLNLARTRRLERDLAVLTTRHEAMRSDVVTYADIVGRQLDPRGDAGLLRRALMAENDATIARMVAGRALRELECGRTETAVEHLRAVLGEAHVPPAPIHLVDRVA